MSLSVFSARFGCDIYQERDRRAFVGASRRLKHHGFVMAGGERNRGRREESAFLELSLWAGLMNQSRRSIAPGFVKSFWEPRFPGQVPSQLVLPEILEGDKLYLEGEELKVVELGHTDTSHSTALHVPSIGLVISGDA